MLVVYFPKIKNMEDAIKQIVSTINYFPDIYKVSISKNNKITVHWKDKEKHKNKFKDAFELLVWCENNLPSKS
jgi:hypothetical protein